MKDKKLKVWNGGGIYSGPYRNYGVNVAAHSQKEAVDMLNNLIGGHYTISYFRDFFSNCWGNHMDGIVPSEPCVYLCDKIKGKPFLVTKKLKQ